MREDRVSILAQWNRASASTIYPPVHGCNVWRVGPILKLVALSCPEISSDETSLHKSPVLFAKHSASFSNLKSIWTTSDRTVSLSDAARVPLLVKAMTRIWVRYCGMTVRMSMSSSKRDLNPWKGTVSQLVSAKKHGFLGAAATYTWKISARVCKIRWKYPIL
jgi:hypothetical protein